MLGLFDQAVPIGIVAIIIYIAIMSRDMRHIRKDLDNHITDTDKKIDKLDTKIEKITDKLSNLEAGQAELKTELRTGQAELKAKIDHLLSASK